MSVYLAPKRWNPCLALGPLALASPPLFLKAQSFHHLQFALPSAPVLMTASVPPVMSAQPNEFQRARLSC